MPEDRDEQDIRINVLSRDKCFVGDREDSITNVERCIPRYLYRAVAVRHPSPSPGLLPRFFQKEREKEMGGKNRSRKETTCNDYSRHRPRDQTLRESTIENRDRTLEEFPIRDSIPLKISREIGISFAGMFLHRYSPSSTQFFPSLFFHSQPRNLGRSFFRREEKKIFSSKVVVAVVRISLEAIEKKKEEILEGKVVISITFRGIKRKGKVRLNKKLNFV